MLGGILEVDAIGAVQKTMLDVTHHTRSSGLPIRTGGRIFGGGCLRLELPVAVLVGVPRRGSL